MRAKDQPLHDLVGTGNLLVGSKSCQRETRFLTRYTAQAVDDGGELRLGRKRILSGDDSLGYTRPSINLSFRDHVKG